MGLLSSLPAKNIAQSPDGVKGYPARAPRTGLDTLYLSAVHAPDRAGRPTTRKVFAVSAIPALTAVGTPHAQSRRVTIKRSIRDTLTGG
jgi:hypothetical protein